MSREVHDIWYILTKHADIIWYILNIWLEIQDIGKLDMAITASKEKQNCLLNVLNSTVLSNVWNNDNILVGPLFSNRYVSGTSKFEDT